MAKTYLQQFFSRLLTALVMLSLSVALSAQQRYSVKMKLSDASTSEPLGFATVSLTVKGGTTPVKYILSTENGTAELTGLAKGTYILKAELMGYKTYEKELELTKSLDLGEIKIAQDAQVLDAASITAVGNPIVVKKDTVEYSASSFKTSDNDMLEELLKKLPGVEVGSDGSITANGETITKVMIDGKEFFLDDPQLATKNIPAKIIEKVRVVEKKSEQAEFTGIDDGDEETVIDLSVKPGMMDGWFGNAMAGGGHDLPEKGYYTDGLTPGKDGWRYQAAAMAGRFTENRHDADDARLARYGAWNRRMGKERHHYILDGRSQRCLRPFRRGHGAERKLHVRRIAQICGGTEFQDNLYGRREPADI